MDRMIRLYHGSTEIVREPKYGLGRLHNDFGQGFYCTENMELAKEWACSSLSDGICNKYEIDTSELNMLNLNSEAYSVLNWIAVLVSNRLFRPGTPVAGRSRRYLEENFAVNINVYDIIIGYRADDAYYDFADAFLNNSITLEQLAEAMKLGRLGEQVVLKSRPAFERIRFLGFEAAERDLFYPIRKARNEKAERDFVRICEKDQDGLFMADIMREGVKNDDARIPRNVSQ